MWTLRLNYLKHLYCLSEGFLAVYNGRFIVLVIFGLLQCLPGLPRVAKGIFDVS